MSFRRPKGEKRVVEDPVRKISFTFTLCVFAYCSTTRQILRQLFFSAKDVADKMACICFGIIFVYR